MFDMNVTEVVVPKFVQVLCSKCFLGRKQVKCVEFDADSALKVIESYALEGTSICRFVVPRLVETIENNAFWGCYCLKEVIFDDECVLKSLTCGMFADLKLKYLFISSNVESIEATSLRDVSNVEISLNNIHFRDDSPEILEAQTRLHC